jgi:hypothetical protein
LWQRRTSIKKLIEGALVGNHGKADRADVGAAKLEIPRSTPEFRIEQLSMRKNGVP